MEYDQQDALKVERVAGHLHPPAVTTQLLLVDDRLELLVVAVVVVVDDVQSHAVDVGDRRVTVVVAANRVQLVTTAVHRLSVPRPGCWPTAAAGLVSARPPPVELCNELSWNSAGPVPLEDPRAENGPVEFRL